MEVNIKTLLHPRIEKHCEKLFDDGHYKHAASEAMIQVELALKEKSGEKKKFGVNLISSLFGEGSGIKLRVPFGEELQKQAESLFRGAFSYYRNYAAHDGSNIDKNAAARIMIFASELLELIGASLLSFRDIGGIKGLIKSGLFSSEKSLMNLLKLLNGYTISDDVVDGFFEDLYENGFTDGQVHSVIDLGLVEYITKKYFPTTEEVKHSHFIPDEVSWFDLTNLGKTLMESKK
jgi:uncharacterized protein (TIGR02391 family)